MRIGINFIFQPDKLLMKNVFFKKELLVKQLAQLQKINNNGLLIR